MATQECRIKMSYDADTDFYTHGHKLRIDLIKFLLENGAYTLRAYVGSTISFSCKVKIDPLQYWSVLLSDEFGENFYSQLSIVQTLPSYDPEQATIVNAKPDFVENFTDDVNTAKKQLKDETKPFYDF